MKQLRGLLSWGLLLCAAAGGCGESASPPVDGLLEDARAFDFEQNPDLLERISATSHGYFRFINIPFGRVVCAEFPELMRSPQVNLHGDAHIEQYSVTDLGRGLTDFDDSSTGPAGIDLVRFSVSLRLASRVLGWDQEQERMIREFLRGYLEALSSPEIEAPEPASVQRIRSGFKRNRAAYFEWVESLLEPVPDEKGLRLAAAMQPYVQSMLSANSALSADYFRIARLGSLKLGIGSALDQKFLVRVQGPSADPLDDTVLEFKQVRDLQGIPCIRAAKDDPFRILLSQYRIAYSPFEFLGYVPFEDTVFWVHSWVENYREVEIRESFESPDEMADVAHDVGIQLGLGHPKLIASPFDAQLRAGLAGFVEGSSPQLLRASAQLADRVAAAWQRFTANAHRPPSP